MFLIAITHESFNTISCFIKSDRTEKYMYLVSDCVRFLLFYNIN